MALHPLAVNRPADAGGYAALQQSLSMLENIGVFEPG